MDSSESTDQEIAGPSSNSTQAAAPDVILDPRANHSTQISDASRPGQAYHRPWEARTTHSESSTRFRPCNRQAHTPYSSRPVRSSQSNRSFQTDGANLPDMTSNRYLQAQSVELNLPIQNFGAHLPNQTPHGHQAVLESGANFPEQTFDFHETLPAVNSIFPTQPLDLSLPARFLHVNFPTQQLHENLQVQPLDLSMSVRCLDENPPAQTVDVNSCVQNFDGSWPVGQIASYLPNQAADVDLPYQPLEINSSDQPASDVSPPDQTVASNSTAQTLSAQPIQTINANVDAQTLGAYAGRDFAVQTMVNMVNAPSSSSNQPPKKSSFRLNIPIPTKHFKGRQDTLKDVRDYFESLDTDVSRPRMAAIVGMGGMGKTETAHKFASESKGKFPSAAWINAETEQGTLKSFCGLAKELGIVGQDQKVADVDLVKQIYRKIAEEDYGNVLFIFDNAIRLGSRGTEFGILEYLPTDDLPNGRYPSILITTQTQDWDKTITTFQVDGLSEEESFAFFSSCFNVESSECADEFKMLHDLLEGYPLCMNLAASCIDFVPNKHSVQDLKDEINLYIDKVNKEKDKLVNEKIKPAWGHEYDKTLSIVWHLTQERLEQEEDGPEALEILQLMSFLRLPVKSNDVVKILVLRTTKCPHPYTEEEDIQLRLKKLFRVIEKLYAVRILRTYKSKKYKFRCELGVHRLVQLVVRQQTNCNQALADVLRYYIVCLKPSQGCVNLSVLDEVLENPRTQLTSRSVLLVAIFACQRKGSRKFFEKRKAETQTEVNIWNLFRLMTGATPSKEIRTQAIRELVRLTKSSEETVDRKFFAKIVFALVYPHYEEDFIEDILNTYYFKFTQQKYLDGIEDLIFEHVMFSFDDSRCKKDYCQKFDIKKVHFIENLVKKFVQTDAQMPKLVAAERIATLWLAFLAKQRDYESTLDSEWRDFWHTMYKTCNSSEASPLKTAELRTCLWDRGLAEELIQAFDWLKSDDWFGDIRFLECIDVCFDGVDLLDVRAQRFISAFTNMATRLWLKCQYSWRKFDCILEVSLAWIKLLLLAGDQTLETLLEYLSRCEALNWFEVSSEDDIRKTIQKESKYFKRGRPIYEKYQSEYFPQFIQRYSSSEVQRIKKLVTFCTIALEELCMEGNSSSESK